MQKMYLRCREYQISHLVTHTPHEKSTYPNQAPASLSKALLLVGLFHVLIVLFLPLRVVYSQSLRRVRVPSDDPRRHGFRVLPSPSLQLRVPFLRVDLHVLVAGEGVDARARQKRQGASHDDD